MKPAGRVLHYLKHKLLIIEAKEKLHPDTTLYTSSGREAAIIIDVIGPINKPYIIAKPLIDKPEKLVGGELYYSRKRRR